MTRRQITFLLIGMVLGFAIFICVSALPVEGAPECTRTPTFTTEPTATFTPTPELPKPFVPWKLFLSLVRRDPTRTPTMTPTITNTPTRPPRTPVCPGGCCPKDP